MAISMTREEYQAKYGVPPPVPPPASANAPIRMTQAQYDAKYGATGGGPPGTQPQNTLQDWGSKLSSMGGLGAIAGPIVGGLGNLSDAWSGFQAGATNNLKNTALGVPEIAAKAMALVPGQQAGSAETVNQIESLKKATDLKAPANTPGQIGAATGDVAATVGTFAAPGGAIVKGQKIAAAATEGMPWIVKMLGQVAPEMGIMGATQGVTSGGDVGSATGVGLAAGALSFITHGASAALAKIIPPDAEANIRQFLSYTGKTTLKQAVDDSKFNNTLGAFTNMVKTNGEKPMTITTTNGIKQVWDPKKTDLYELPQVLWQTMKNTYDKYTALAGGADAAGANFGQKEFTAVINKLTPYIESGTNAEKSAAQGILDYIQRQGTTMEDGTTYFKNTSLSAVQDMIQKINSSVAKGEATAVHQVASDISVTMREMMDSKIEGATGAKYQAARDEYAQLKSTEADILKRYKQAMAQSGQFTSDLIDGLGAIDILQSALTLNPVMAARGLSILAVKGIFKYIRNPENSMARAFNILAGGEQKAATTLGQRFFGVKNAVAPAVKASVGMVGAPTSQ